MERGNGMKNWVGVAGLLFCSIFTCQMAEASTTRIQNGSSVHLSYTLEADGKTIISEQNKALMDLVVGMNSRPPAFESQLIGLRKGDSKEIRLVPEQAFGPVRPELVKRVPNSELPPSLKLQEGMIMGGKNSKHQIRVAKVLDDSVVLDENHPFAGKTLVYQVKVDGID